jgi:uncharacterized membrane protein
MQSINVTVINPLFLTVFLGTAVACVLLANFSMLRWHRPDSGLLLAGSVTYLLGTILVTIVCNVPRNDRLAAVDAASAEAARMWSAYLTQWTSWNYVRTIASLAAAAALTLALRC